MRGRRATPKQRLVCGPCLAWVTRDERAELVGDTSPADDHGADSGNCHYAQNVNMGSCEGNHVLSIWMRSKCASPKGRDVCQSCADWLVRENLADIVPTAPPVESKNVCHLILVAVLSIPN